MTHLILTEEQQKYRRENIEQQKIRWKENYKMLNEVLKTNEKDIYKKFDEDFDEKEACDRITINALSQGFDFQEV